MTEEQASFSSYERHSDTDALLVMTSSPLSTNQPGDDNVWENTASTGTRNWRPPRLLLTLLGDYWWRQNELLPSAALVALLTEFGVSDTAARGAIGRLVRHGLLTTSKQGRQTFHKISERAMRILDDGARRIFSFGLHPRPWDGMWSLVAFSIPEENRQLRYILRDRLRWLGFAPLYDGLWISPQDTLREAASQLAELSINTVTMFRAQTVEGTTEGGLPQRAWDLEAVCAQYQKFIADIHPLESRVRNGTLSPEEALTARTRLMDAWRSFPALDPDLPEELLPPDWPRARARQLFIEMYDALGPLAERRIQQIIARYAPELASKVRYHRSDTLLSTIQS
jgi:phenylacetic acid degradation operon negative regulatory protein